MAFGAFGLVGALEDGLWKYGVVLKLAIGLELLGELKSCTCVMLGLAAEKHERMSYAKYTRMLTGR